MIFTQKNTVRASACDFTTDLSLIGAFHAVEDAYCAFFKELGADGISVLQTYGATWVYTKHKMQVFRKLPWNSLYTAECFLSRISGLIAVTDIVFRDEAGGIALYSQIELCLLDVNAQRIKPLADIGFDKNAVHPSHAESSFSRLVIKDAAEVCKIKVKNCNTDYNGHTNNTEYIRFLLDSYDMETLQRHPIRSIEIHYLNQSRLHDTLTISRTSDNGCDKTVVMRDDTPIVKCAVMFG